MSVYKEEHILAIGKVLKNTERPLKERFRALFTLRNIGGAVAINCIKAVFVDNSALLKHELAYCLGQMQDQKALTYLQEVLKDKMQEPIVRHEAAEAIGAIGSPESIALLQRYVKDEEVAVAQTCELALDRIKLLQSDSKQSKLKSDFTSIDPAPADVSDRSNDVDCLKGRMLGDDSSLFDRYKMMFALRNLQSDEATVALCEGLKYGGPNNALFRHEIAFVLGQLQRPISVPYLISCLEDLAENEMVRHECAEALGAIATTECTGALQRFLGDEKRVVRESCEIALDMCEYENSAEFQYANTLSEVR